MEHNNVWVQFNYKPGECDSEGHRFMLKELVYRSTDLDCAIVKLCNPHNANLPPPITKFNNVGQGVLHLIGHDGGNTKKLDPACIIQNPTSDQVAEAERILNGMGHGRNLYAGIISNDRVHFQCSFKHGSSGSPGVVRCGDQLYVVTMISKGYPDFYYRLNDQQQREISLPNEFFIEEGIDITAILGDLHTHKTYLYEDITGNVS